MEKFVEKLTPIDGPGPWGGYRNNSVGRLIHYIYKICGLNIAESITIGSKNIQLGGKVIAKVDWSKGYPHMLFENQAWNERQASLLALSGKCGVCGHENPSCVCKPILF